MGKISLLKDKAILEKHVVSYPRQLSISVIEAELIKDQRAQKL